MKSINNPFFTTGTKRQDELNRIAFRIHYQVQYMANGSITVIFTSFCGKVKTCFDE